MTPLDNEFQKALGEEKLNIAKRIANQLQVGCLTIIQDIANKVISANAKLVDNSKYTAARTEFYYNNKVYKLDYLNPQDYNAKNDSEIPPLDASLVPDFQKYLKLRQQVDDDMTLFKSCICNYLADAEYLQMYDLLPERYWKLKDSYARCKCCEEGDLTNTNYKTANDIFNKYIAYGALA